MNTNRNKKGLVLVGVLWIIIVLTAIVAILGRQSRLDSKMVLAKSEAIRTKWASRAGIERAVAVLNEDEKDTDCDNDTWYSDTEDFNDFKMTRCSYNVIVSDESGKLNINTATFDQLMGLPYMTEDVADAITDWRDSDSDVNGLGTEDGYYENLTYGYLIRNTPFRTIRELLLVKGVTDELFYGEDTNLNGKLDYNEKDGDVNPPADNGDEYLDVGWAAYITCYPTGTASAGTTGTTTDANQTAELTSPITDNSSGISAAAYQNTGSLILTAAVNTGSYATLSAAAAGNSNAGGSQTTGGQTGNQTTTNQTTQNTQTTTQQQTTTTQQTQTNQTTGQAAATEGQININTASETVLAALMGGTNEAYAAAEAIIGYRENLQYGIEDITELTQNGIISSDMFSLIQNYVTISSNIFRITCTATADRGGKPGTALTTEVVIDRSTSPYKVLYWYQGASN